MADKAVFVSYSRKHESQVTKVVALIRSVAPQVFQDVSSVKPGDDWEHVIVDSLDRADLVLVFWCNHARASQWVGKEMRRAIEGGKRIVPVRIDGTPLSDQLSRYQALDMSGFFPHKTEHRLLVPLAAATLLTFTLLILTALLHVERVEIKAAQDTALILHVLEQGWSEAQGEAPGAADGRRGAGADVMDWVLQMTTKGYTSQSQNLHDPLSVLGETFRLDERRGDHDGATERLRILQALEDAQRARLKEWERRRRLRVNVTFAALFLSSIIGGVICEAVERARAGQEERDRGLAAELLRRLAAAG